MSANPLVSIVLPTFNRERFLADAFASIAGQDWTSWELIVVDDGSRDGTREAVERLTRASAKPVRYVYQENQGAFAARNAGVALASGSYVAFFDSDDLWHPHHLRECVAALEHHPSLAWVYGACSVEDARTRALLSPSTFYIDGRARPFLALQTRRAGALHIIEDPGAVRCMITHGLFCALQASVIRTDVLRRIPLPAYRIGEDRVFPIQVLKAGYKLGYFNRVHASYRVHDGHTSAASHTTSLERQRETYLELIRSYEGLQRDVALDRREVRTLRRQIAYEYFWHVGYSTCWIHGSREEALAMFRRGLSVWPWDWHCWKTFLLASLRARAGRPVWVSR